MIWILSICFGPTWFGCRSVAKIEYPTYEACMAAMEVYTKQDATAVCTPNIARPDGKISRRFS